MHIIVVRSLSHVQLYGTAWTLACQALLSVEFPRQEYWRGLPFPSPGELLTRIESVSPPLAGGLFTTEPPGKPNEHISDKPKKKTKTKPMMEKQRSLSIKAYLLNKLQTLLVKCRKINALLGKKILV